MIKMIMRETAFALLSIHLCFHCF